MHQENHIGPEDHGTGISARRRLVRLLEARRAFLAGDVEGAVGAYTGLIDPARPHPTAMLDLRGILLLLDRMGAADPEFRRARDPLRARLVGLLEGGG
jgi:hypothetical protein